MAAPFRPPLQPRPLQDDLAVAIGMGIGIGIGMGD